MEADATTEEQKPHPRGTRPRRERIEVWVDATEKAALAAKATESGLSMAAYLRSSGLNHPIRSRVDLMAVTDLAKVNGELGRVAELLKLWLSEKAGHGAKLTDVESLMKDFRGLQANMLTVMTKVIR